MIKYFSDKAALKLLIFISIGAISNHYFEIAPLYLFIVAFLSLISLFSFRLKPFSFVFYLTSSLFAGALIQSFAVDKNFPVVNKVISEQKSIFKGEIRQIIKQDSNGIRFIARGSLDLKTFRKIDDVNLLFTIPKANNIELEVGTSFLSKCSIIPAKPKQYKSKFDEKKYLEYYECIFFAKTWENQVAIYENQNLLKQNIYTTQKAISSFIKSNYSVESAGIVNALLTGDRTLIDKEVTKEFSLTGITHILSISGLHIGLIGVAIFNLLGFINSRWLKFGIFVSLVFAFVAITGFQASALRAAFMLLIYYLVKSLDRKANAINILSFCVIILLSLFPNYLYSLAFQLSVISVLSILFFYERIENLIRKVNKNDNLIFSYVLNSFAVTIAATIGIGPILAYHFEIYSISSLIANLVAIPLTNLVLIFSFFSLFFAYIPFISDLYIKASEILIHLTLNFNSFLANLDYSYIEGNQSFFLALIISISIIYLIYASNLRHLIFRLCSLSFAIFIVVFYFPLEREKEDKIQIFPSNQLVLLHYQNDSLNHYFYAIERKPKQYPKLDYNMQRYILEQRGNLVIAYSGLAGIKLCDEVQYKRKAARVEIDLATINKIQKVIQSNQKIPQIIEYK